MKKLNSITNVTFERDSLYLEDIPLTIGINIENWLKEFCNIPYEFENYSKLHTDLIGVKFISIYGIYIYIENKIITDIYVYPYTCDTSPYYKGDIFIGDKKLEVPFLSDDIEEYFPNIKTDKPPRGYWDRFVARESVDYLINDKTKIEISMSRLPKYVGSISLKNS
jgi:hypothetical protein